MESPQEEIKNILESRDPVRLKNLFAFDATNSDESVIFKFRLWSSYLFHKYFSSPDADFHSEIDLGNLNAYRGQIDSFTDIAFRGAAKTARTKLFIAFCIANDQDHFRKYIKVLSEDGTNSTQIVTDVYNMLVKESCRKIYPEIFEKTTIKREETMHSFTTSTGIKMIADTVGTTQRGSLQDDARPDWILFEDFETRTTLRSARKTNTIWDNMEEARTGLAKGGSCIYNCNYLSELANVHKLVMRKSNRHSVLIVPILTRENEPAWSRYTKAEIDQMRVDDVDFEGERMCKPSASKDIYFDREMLDKQEAKIPVREISGFKIFKVFNPAHRYASGHDVAGGVGLDSSTSVFIDFETIPAQVVGTFKNNLIKPDIFGDEILRETDMFGHCLSAIEKNNHGHATIARAKQLEVDQYTTQGKVTTIGQPAPKEYGWHTNALSKPKMLTGFAKAIESGLIDLNDPDLIAEAKSYTRNDLIDTEPDPRLTTRHFDLLIAACIAWQMKDHAVKAVPGEYPTDEKPSEFSRGMPTDPAGNPFHYEEEEIVS